MKRKFMLFVLLAMSVTISKAQVPKSAAVLGGNLTVNHYTSKYNGNGRDKATYISISPSLAKFIETIR